MRERLLSASTEVDHPGTPHSISTIEFQRISGFVKSTLLSWEQTHHESFKVRGKRYLDVILAEEEYATTK